MGVYRYIPILLSAVGCHGNHAFLHSPNGLVLKTACFTFKPHSHCAGVATVHPDAGQPVYRDAPGHIS